MPILGKLKEVLDQAKVSYEIYNHPQAFTAQETAAAQHASGKEMAKVVILKIDHAYVMAVVPGDRQVDFRRLKVHADGAKLSLATEDEFAALFPECEIGAMPPFGNLFGLPVYVDSALAKDEWIFFNAGNHVQTVRMRFEDFAELVKPRTIPLAVDWKRKAA